MSANHCLLPVTSHYVNSKQVKPVGTYRHDGRGDEASFAEGSYSGDKISAIGLRTVASKIRRDGNNRISKSG